MPEQQWEQVRFKLPSVDTFEQAMYFAEIEGLEGEWLDAEQVLSDHRPVIATLRDRRTDVCLYMVPFGTEA